ncbi:MAG: phage tail protein [Bacteroidales bacterium]|nr:phage tail protein [Bacteroidales bacterium]
MPKPETLAGANIPEYIEIKPATGNTVAFLSPKSDDLLECWIDDEQNSTCTIELEMPLESEKWVYLTDKYRIYADDKEFVINNPDAMDKQREGKKLTGKVKAHESWILLGKKYQTISNDPSTPSPAWGAVIIVSGGASHGGFDPGSAGSALSYLLVGTGWTVGTVDVAGTYDLETEKESVLANINKVQETWGGILVWDSVNHTVSLRDEATWQNYTGYQIRYAKNLKGISRTDDYDIVTRLYPFGENDLNIADVNGSLLYLDNISYSTEVLEGVWYNQDIADQTKLKTAGEKQLAVMCKPRHNYKTEVLDLRSLPGYGHETFARSDMVDLYDEEFGADARVRIIRYRHNVFQPWLCDMELGDPLEKIAASVAQSIVMAKFYKNVVAPNTSFQNLLKAIINTAATEINGASGDYTCIDGVSTWLNPNDGSLTRITPEGLVISPDGGQTWQTAIDGNGFYGNAAWVEKIVAAAIQVGADSTFEPGYDPTKGAMGVDSDCTALFHFDGSLNSHKGLTPTFTRDSVAYLSDGTQVPAGVPRFEDGKFGKGVMIEEGTTNLLTANQSSVETDLTGFTNANMNMSRDNAHAKHGTYALKAAWTSIAGDAYVVPYGITINPNTTYSWQAWVYAESEVYLPLQNCYIIEFGGNWRGTGAAGTGLTKIPAGIWTKIGGTGTTNSDWISGANSAILLRPPCDSAGNTLTTPIWVDCLQIEQKGYATSWQIGGCVPLMTADNVPAPYAVSTSFAQYPGNYAYAAFDGSPNTDMFSHSTYGVTTGTFNIDLGMAQVVNRYEMMCQTNMTARAPYTWTFEGSNDNSTWTVLDTHTAYTGWVAYASSFFDFVNSTAYRYYRINVTGANPSSDGHLTLSKIQIYNVRLPEGLAIPTAGVFEKGNWTIALTHKPTSAMNIGNIVKTLWICVVDANNYYQFMIGWDGEVIFQVYSGGVLKQLVGYAASQAIGTDNSYVITGDGAIMTLTINGVTQSLAYTEPVGILPANMYVGNSGGYSQCNGIIDELRIDKVARTPEVIASWHNANAPFYSSEDTAQLPGYLKAETDGYKVYDSAGELRVLLGSWLKDAVRKYGLKIIGGEIYSSVIRTGTEGAADYIALDAGYQPLRVVKGGKDALTIFSQDDGGYIQILNPSIDDLCGQILPTEAYYEANGLKIQARSWAGGNKVLALVGSEVIIDPDSSCEVYGNLSVNGNLSCTGSKPAQQVTENFGLRYMYATESPEVIYYDRGRSQLKNGECTVYFDSIYLECLEPDTDATPWLIRTEVYGQGEDVRVIEWGDNYFKVKEENNGTSNRKFGWWHDAVRKGYAGIRLMEVLD